MQTLQKFFIIESNPATINTLWNSSTIFHHCTNEKRLEEQLRTILKSNAVWGCGKIKVMVTIRECAWKDISQQVADDH